MPGVSGGPVLRRRGDSTLPVDVIGSISSYRRAASGISPGLSVAQDVSHFQAIVTRLRDADEAARQKKQQEALIAAKAVVGGIEPKPDPESGV